MDDSEARTTWKFGECEISYERNISSLMLVDLQTGEKHGQAASGRAKTRRPRAQGRNERKPG